MTEEKPKKGSEKKPKNTANQQGIKVDKTTIYVGKKPVKNYVIACLTLFNAGAREAVIKARGRAIPRAIDTVELLRRAFLKDAKLQEIAISTEEIPKEDGRKSNVSAIEIKVAKP